MNQVNKRTTLLLILLLFIPFFLILRLFYLQIWCREELSEMAKRQIESRFISPVTRGEIMDTNGKLLAVNVEVESIGVNPRVIRNKEYFAKKISEILPISKKDILEKIKSKKYFVWIARQIPKNISDKLKKEKLEGVEYIVETKRYYPLGSITSQIVGVAGIDGKGLSGVELLYDDLLLRENSVEIYKKDGINRVVKVSDNRKEKYFNVVLTLDINLQYITYRAIKNAYEKHNPKKVLAIVQEPLTGQILAMASIPSFNPNEENFKVRDLLNPAVNEIFEPGSVLKIVPALAGMCENLFNEESIINCENGSYRLADDVVITDHEKYNWLTFEGILAHSSNIGFAKVGQSLGNQKIYDWMRKFGFGSPTGSGIPGEARGILRLPTAWSGVTGPIMCYGHGISVTALQIVNAYSSIANGGYLLEPRIIKVLKDSEGNVILNSEKRIIRKIAEESEINRLKEMLKKVVDYGTGTKAKVEGYSVAGKTGTAQKIDPSTGKYGNAHVSSFCGFIPYEEPALTILVVIDEPKGTYWAGEIACPVFSEIASDAMNYIKLKKTQNYAFFK